MNLKFILFLSFSFLTQRHRQNCNKISLHYTCTPDCVNKNVTLCQSFLVDVVLIEILRRSTKIVLLFYISVFGPPYSYMYFKHTNMLGFFHYGFPLWRIAFYCLVTPFVIQSFKILQDCILSFQNRRPTCCLQRDRIQYFSYYYFFINNKNILKKNTLQITVDKT